MSNNPFQYSYTPPTYLMNQGGVAQANTTQAQNGPSLFSRFWNWLNPKQTSANPAMSSPSGVAGLGGSIPTVPANATAPGMTLDPNATAPAGGSFSFGVPTAQAATTASVPVGGYTGPALNSGAGGTPITTSFNAAFNALSPDEQKAYIAANPGVNLQTGFPQTPSNITSQNYSINPGGTIDSSSTNPTATVNDALSAASSARAGLLNGSSPSNYVPSDGLYGSVINGIFNASQYSPQELDQINSFNNLQSTIIQTQLAARRQLTQMQQDGTITQDQAKAFLSEAQRRSEAQMADLAATQSGNTLALQTLALMRQNQLGAFQNIAQFLKPEQVSPGSSLVNPVTGQTTFTGQGAAPSTIMQTAQTLAMLAMQSGTMQYNPDGTPNLQPYLEQAQNYYNTHQILSPGTTPGQATMPGISGSSPAGGGNIVQEAYNYGVSAGLPPTLAGAVIKSPITGDYYISGERTTGIPDAAIASQSGRSGIAYVPAANVGNIQQLDIAIGQMQQLNTLAKQYLSSGLGGRLAGLTTNQLSTFLQNDPGWARFNAVRLQAIDYLKGLAQGGGFRTTQSEIDTAANALTDISDNLESSQAKMDTAMKNINLAYKEYLPTHQDTSLNAPQQSQRSSAPASSNPFSPSNFYGQ